MTLEELDLEFRRVARENLAVQTQYLEAAKQGMELRAKIARGLLTENDLKFVSRKLVARIDVNVPLSELRRTVEPIAKSRPQLLILEPDNLRLYAFQ